MHDVITVGVPLVVIMFGILFNRAGLNDLKADVKQAMNDLRNDLKAEIRASEARVTERVTILERDYRDFFKTQAQLEMRMDAVEKKP